MIKERHNFIIILLRLSSPCQLNLLMKCHGSICLQEMPLNTLVVVFYLLEVINFFFSDFFC
jgi:hypothetical protein